MVLPGTKLPSVNFKGCFARHRSALVDQYCRVHGLDNIRVADARVMPNVARANTNPATIKIGERAADWIKEV